MVPDLTGTKTMIVPSLSIPLAEQTYHPSHRHLVVTFLHRLYQVAKLALSEAIGCSRPYPPSSCLSHLSLEKAGRLIPGYHEGPILLAVAFLLAFSLFHALPSSNVGSDLFPWQRY